MMSQSVPRGKAAWRGFATFLSGFAIGALVMALAMNMTSGKTVSVRAGRMVSVVLRPREYLDTSGFGAVTQSMPPWQPSATLQEISKYWEGAGQRLLEAVDQGLSQPGLSSEVQVSGRFMKAMLHNYNGDPEEAARSLEEARTLVERDEDLKMRTLSTLLYFQGVTALRQGENDNCVECRGESSCILPINTAARHLNPTGSRRAIRHFTEYLESFPDDLEARWLLNLAHMTLGEHPAKVDPRYLINLDRFRESEFDIGAFRDIGHEVGVNRFNQAGGAILDDFDNDGRLDLVVTSWDATMPMAFYHNKGDGTFEERTGAGVSDQLGGLFCVQGDYDNDGDLDIFIPRGAWIGYAVRPSLLRNNGDGTFVDVTETAGALDPVNSNSAAWADYDNDGWLDLFVCCERQSNRLYRNRGDGTFEDMTATAGLVSSPRDFCKGVTWIDYDNDDWPDLFLNNLGGTGRLYRNNRKGQFSDVSPFLGIDGPPSGFSCWAWDYDNDGWLDLFATCYDRTLEDVVKGAALGQPHALRNNRLFRNVGGKGFADMTEKAGLNLVFSAMGSNFADFDNDGYLDFYLGTGEPNLGTLIPNRMFRNVDGERFAEITGSSRTGHLQKGHAVACGDWDRDGDVDLFVQTGGATNGDRYHNILFQNPGQKNRSITLKLIGVKSNRSAIGARIKAVTAGRSPRTIHRHVTSGSSFGANPLEQTIGLGPAEGLARLEVHWPTSGTNQVFHDLAAGQYFEITEFADTVRRREVPTMPESK